MEFNALLEARRSVRAFDDTKAVTKEQIKTLKLPADNTICAVNRELLIFNSLFTKVCLMHISS